MVSETYKSWASLMARDIPDEILKHLRDLEKLVGFYARDLTRRESDIADLHECLDNYGVIRELNGHKLDIRTRIGIAMQKPKPVVTPRLRNLNRPSRDWIPGQDGVVALLDDEGNRIEGAPLPALDQPVEALMFDGLEIVAVRSGGFEPGCGWIWQTATGWLIPGHPLLVCWRPDGTISDQESDKLVRSVV